MSTADDEFMRAGLDPAFRFEPIVRPVLSVDDELARISAAFALSAPCPHCGTKPDVDEMAGDLPKVVGITHLPGCPNYAPED